MSGKNVKFGGKKIKKVNFTKNKKAFKIYDKYFNKMFVSKEEPHGSN